MRQSHSSGGRLWLAATTAFAALATGAQAFAQEAAAGTAEEEIVVTGTRIGRSAATAPTPLIQIEINDILQSGQANVIDYLADVPALSNSLVPEDTTGGGLGVGGLSLLDLRALGPNRTLVLVDGRRHVGSAYFASNAVDVDTIPRLLIKDIEIITGGASAVYGADAVTGVVNFILRKEFDGLELDGALAQINQEGQLNGRLSGLVGGGERMRYYLSAEYENSQEVFDRDIDWLREGGLLIQNDLDPLSPNSDGVPDIIAVTGLGTISRPQGGVLTLARTLRPSAASDPDFAVTPCAAAGFSANCFVLDPGFSFTFNDNGVARPLDFGTFRAAAGVNRTNVIGSSDARRLVDQGTQSRLPDSEILRLQSGFTFDLASRAELFAEAKFIREETVTQSSPVFFNIGIRPFGPNQSTIFNSTAVNNFEIGVDNAFLDPAIRQAILTNQRAIYAAPTADAPSVQTGSVLDQRAFFQNLLSDYGYRPQFNERETLRFVAGVRGDSDTFGPLRDARWEVGYTYGEVEDSNLEAGAFDSERYAFAADAVVDSAGLVNGNPGEIVCRVQLLAAQGIPIPLNADIVGNRAVRRNYNPNDPAITDCTPIDIFGTSDIPDEVSPYLTTFISRGFRTVQQDVMGFVSGDLWDLWGAGAIGVALGGEYRKETFKGVIGGPPNRNDRVLFNNVYTITPESSYDVGEAFVEVKLPLLRDLPLAQEVELSGAYRYSDYSNIGGSETWSSQASWRLSDDIFFRGTYGVSVRTPTLNELFRGPAQTFVQVTDTCSRPIIDATADPTIRANRNANCLALGVPTDYVDPNPTITNPGVNGPNPNLTQETSTSWTASVVLTPRFAPGLSLVVDYYNISIDDAIASLQVNTILQLCTDQATPNAAACALITRDPGTFEITHFLQGFFNYAGLHTSGIDFSANWGFGLGDTAGRLDFSLKGNYLIRLQNFTDPLNPSTATQLDTVLNYPRVRLRLESTYEVGPFAATWAVDHQTSQEIFDDVLLVNDPDNRDRALIETGEFTTHDFLLRWDLSEDLRLRAGVVNAFDADPPIQARGLNIPNAVLGLGGDTDQFDIFGRRFFIGFAYRR